MTELKSLQHYIYEDCGKDVVRVQTDISREVYEYLFHKVICYTHGSRRCIMAFFFQRFYEELQRQKIPAVWDEDNYFKIIEILNNLNFQPPKQNARRPVSKRRTNIPSPVNQTQPASEGLHTGPTSGTCQANTNVSHVPPNLDFDPTKGVRNA